MQIRDAVLFSPFFYCLMVARFADVRSSILAIFTSTGVTNYFFLDPDSSLSFRGTKGLISAGYMMMCLMSLVIIRSILKLSEMQAAIIEQEKRTAQQNAQMTATLQIAVKARDTFLAVAGHELKTPLTALYLQAQKWQRKVRSKKNELDPADLEDAMNRQLSSVEAMVNLVEQLLDVTRIDTNTLGFACSNINLHDFLAVFLVKFDVLTARSGCVIEKRGDQNTVLYWDKTRLEQVMTNLINNAIKYAAKAPIVVAWKTHANHTVIQVIDHGKGIAPKDRKRIFQKFSRLNENGETAAPPGLGLGLWITHQIVATAGGSITVDEADGGGTVFSVIIPQPSEPQTKGHAVHSLAVLADHSGTSRELCKIKA